MKIEYRDTASITPYAGNPRHNSRAVDAVAASIREFGFLVPCVVDAEGVIVAGHTRHKAAQVLGLTKVPVITADALTPQQIKAFRLADNKVAEISSWDATGLVAELEEISGLDMREFGFVESDFEAVIDAKADDFDPDENATEPQKTKPGELWSLGAHRLLVGDARDAEDVRRLTGGEKMDLLLTDPPYGVDYTGGRFKARRRIEADGTEKTALFELLQEAFKAAAGALKNGAAFYIFHAETNRMVFETAANSAGWKVKQVLIWLKNQSTLGRQDYRWIHEPILYGWTDGAAHYFTFDVTQSTVFDNAPNIHKMSKAELKAYIKESQNAEPTTVFREAKPIRSDEHPTKKPVPLLGRLISNSTRRGEAILDTFAGSGSTLIAAEQLGRRCYCMEIDPRYCDGIISRYEELTGEKAERVK